MPPSPRTRRVDAPPGAPPPWRRPQVQPVEEGPLEDALEVEEEAHAPPPAQAQEDAPALEVDGSSSTCASGFKPFRTCGCIEARGTRRAACGPHGFSSRRPVSHAAWKLSSRSSDSRIEGRDRLCCPRHMRDGVPWPVSLSLKLWGVRISQHDLSISPWFEIAHPVCTVVTLKEVMHT
jgi:hypothetical protein